VRGEANREKPFQAGYPASPAFLPPSGVHLLFSSSAIASATAELFTIQNSLFLHPACSRPTHCGVRNGQIAKRPYYQTKPGFLPSKQFANNYKSTTCKLSGSAWLSSISAYNHTFCCKFPPRNGLFRLQTSAATPQPVGRPVLESAPIPRASPYFLVRHSFSDGGTIHDSKFTLPP
jgi:hypothetical protein